LLEPPPPELRGPVHYVLGQALRGTDASAAGGGRGELKQAAELLESSGLRAGAHRHRHLTVAADRGQRTGLGARPGAGGDRVATRNRGVARGTRFTNPAYVRWRALLAPALAATGQVSEARTIMSPAVKRARRFGAPGGSGWLYARPVLAPSVRRVRSSPPRQPRCSEPPAVSSNMPTPCLALA
jgi:hypothetical protein